MKFLLSGILMLGSLSAFSASKLMIDVKLVPAGEFQGVSQEIKGDLIKKGSEFSADKIMVNVNSIKTGIDLRDEHLWKHLNFSKYGAVVLKNLKGRDGKATALLEVSGVQAPVNINYKENGKKVMASFEVSAKNFKLPEADYMGIGVEDKVKAMVEMDFKTI